MDKMESAATQAPAAVVPVIEKMIEEAPAVPPPVVEKAVEVTTSIPAAADILGGLPTDLPLPVIGGVVIAVIAAALVLAGGGGGEKGSSDVRTASSSADVGNASSSTPSDDVSIPYDAAAMLAYEEAGKPGDFHSFKTKYLADTVAMIKSKQKK
jgi:hypothetical protein